MPRCWAWRIALPSSVPIGLPPWMERFDLVLCNPPYIPASHLDGLMPEVARYEPQSRSMVVPTDIPPIAD